MCVSAPRLESIYETRGLDRGYPSSMSREIDVEAKQGKLLCG